MNEDAYSDNLENQHLATAKASSLTDCKLLNISNIKELTIDRSRELSRGSNTDFPSCLSITKPQNPYRFRLLAFALPLIAHIVLLAVLFLNKEPPVPPHQALLRVQTVQLGKPASSTTLKQESLPAIAPALPVKEEPKAIPLEEATPLEETVHTEELEPVPPKEEIVEKKPVKKEVKGEDLSHKPKKSETTPKKETKAKPASKKEESSPKKEPKKSSSKKESSPVKSTPKKEKASSSSSDSLADAALGILDNLKKGGTTAAEKVKGAIRAPAGLSSLKSSTAANFDSPDYLSRLERSYQDEIAYTLQYNLVLPEQGEVVVSLTLLSDGKVKTVKIVHAESSKNSDYVSRKVKELHFSSFKDLFTGEKDHTFTITLCNK